MDKVNGGVSPGRARCTRYTNKIKKAQPLLDRQYDRRTDELGAEHLKKVENEVAVLDQMTEFLVQKKFGKTKDHQDEVKELEEEIAASWDRYQTNIHARAAAAAQSPAAARRPPPVQDSQSVKLVSETNPDTLTHDLSAGELRIWCRKYEAYCHASNMQLPRNQVQQAYLLNCLDSELYVRLTSSIAATTPVIVAMNSCLNPLTNIFRQKYPLLLRRKTFFQLQQKTGQDESAFVKHLKAAAAEVDFQGMNLEDALCLVTISGLKDSRLREKLSKLENPTMPTFSVLIDAHMHAKATAGGSAAAAAASAASTNKGQEKKKNSSNNNNSRPPLSDTEKKRRTIMKGKCYRCGSPDHMANACNVAKDVKCKKCNTTGHTAAACISGQARATYERENTSQNSTLAR